jgi:hypothetical protein
MGSASGDSFALPGTMRNSERGAILIHVAFALMALLCFTAVVMDHGAMLSARRQAQTAADAGALAGALSLQESFTNTTEAELAAKHFAGANAVWGQATAAEHVIVSTPLPFPCPGSGALSCIRVDVLRGTTDRDNVLHTNYLPTYMARLFGVDTQGVRATATAEVAAANMVKCIKPWIVADRWIDNSGTGTNTSAFDQLDSFNPGVDSYAPGAEGTGFSAETDVGYELMLKGEGRDWSAGWSMEIDLGGGNGANAYRNEIGGCPDYVPEIGLYDPEFPCVDRDDWSYEHGCLNVKTGVRQGPTEQGVRDLIALDDEAEWDPDTNTVVGGCMADGSCDPNPTGALISPRIVPIALFDPQAYIDAGYTGENGMARVVNLLGFFVAGMCNDVYPVAATRPAWCGTNSEARTVVVGRLMEYPGTGGGAAGPAGPQTFITMTRLIR